MSAVARSVSASPVSAVARDAHWALKLARLRARQLPEHTLRICDDLGAKQQLEQARLEAARCRMADAERSNAQDLWIGFGLDASGRTFPSDRLLISE
ncbi:hypothetical protein AB0G73_36225 [Streptomyces sp. NPDC020719]|uniref:hypothetical protein n=1 Tax=Streptomyces sp. NPDC020719 TaxID=3154896 RepID=UPI0033FAC215